MSDSPSLLLSFIIFAPALGALVLAFFPSQAKDAIRFVTLGVTILVLVPVLLIALPGEFDISVAEMQYSFAIEWIPSFSIQYFMGLDGISFPLVALTAIISVFAMGASWSIDKHVN